MTDSTIALDELKLAIARRAAADASFRAELLAAPRETVQKLLASDLPSNVAIQIVEEAPNTYVVVLPAPEVTSGELSDADLEAVSGGTGKANSNRSAQLVASLSFGGLIGVSAGVVGDIARSTGDTKTQASANKAAKNIASCGAGLPG